MCIMQFLNLNGNQIGDTGMISLADALGKGALAQLKDLYIYQYAPALNAACEARGIEFH